jgi:hypothetical protein
VCVCARARVWMCVRAWLLVFLKRACACARACAQVDRQRETPYRHWDWETDREAQFTRIALLRSSRMIRRRLSKRLALSNPHHHHHHLHLLLLLQEPRYHALGPALSSIDFLRCVGREEGGGGGGGATAAVAGESFDPSGAHNAWEHARARTHTRTHTHEVRARRTKPTRPRLSHTSACVHTHKRTRRRREEEGCDDDDEEEEVIQNRTRARRRSLLRRVCTTRGGGRGGGGRGVHSQVSAFFTLATPLPNHHLNPPLLVCKKPLNTRC